MVATEKFKLKHSKLRTLNARFLPFHHVKPHFALTTQQRIDNLQCSLSEYSEFGLLRNFQSVAGNTRAAAIFSHSLAFFQRRSRANNSRRVLQRDLNVTLSPSAARTVNNEIYSDER